MTRLPPSPDFSAIESAASGSSERRNALLALIGNIVFSWSNNESMFIYVLMLLMETNQTVAAVVFATLNTTRARLELIQRLARARIADRLIARELETLIERFNDCTRLRNEFNHSMFVVNESGDLTHTQALRIQERRGRMAFGMRRSIDENRLNQMREGVAELSRLNRDLWAFLPRLEAYITGPSRPTTPPTG
jgi:hypothetical protein